MGRNNPICLFLIPTMGSLVFWLLTAPKPNFGFSFLWVLASGVIVIVVDMFSAPIKGWILFSMWFAALAMPVVLHTLSGEYNGFKTLLTTRDLRKALDQISITKGLVLPLGNDAGFHSAPVTRLTTFKTDCDLILYVPESGNQCWDSLLPCTPEPDSHLCLRTKGDLRSGFTKKPNSPEPVSRN
jgi:hypothetical protein